MGAKRGTGGASSTTGYLTQRGVGRFSLWLKGEEVRRRKNLPSLAYAAGLRSPALPYGRSAQVVLRKKLAVVLMAVMMLVMLAPPALAIAGGGGQDGIKDGQKTEPKGRLIGEGQEPEHAADPKTGKLNKIDHGNPQNGS